MKGEIEPPDDILKKVNKVTAKEVQDLAKEIFVDEGLNMAIIGRFKDGDSFKPFFKL